MIFRSKDAHFAGLLSQEAGDGPKKFSARNFLLDGGVSESRADSYLTSQAACLAAEGLSSLDSRKRWMATHGDYLREKVQLLRQPGMALPEEMDPADPQVCPETFRSQDMMATYGGVDLALHLLRFVDLKSLMMLARLALGDAAPDQAAVLQAARRIVQARDEKKPAAEDDEHLVRVVLDAWNSKADLRPTFVGFYAEHQELFEPGTSLAWADELRNRLGLYHFGPEPMFLFSYPVSKVPRLAGWRLPRPLAIPTVLDGQTNEAFCPAPKGSASGRLVNLAAQGGEPAGEVLHPYLHLDLEHLFRVGEITKEAPTDLEKARRSHIGWLRRDYPDFAHDTDP